MSKIGQPIQPWQWSGFCTSHNTKESKKKKGEAHSVPCSLAHLKTGRIKVLSGLLILSYCQGEREKTRVLESEGCRFLWGIPQCQIKNCNDSLSQYQSPTAAIWCISSHHGLTTARKRFHQALWGRIFQSYLVYQIISFHKRNGSYCMVVYYRIVKVPTSVSKF